MMGETIAAFAWIKAMGQTARAVVVVFATKRSQEKNAALHKKVLGEARSAYSSYFMLNKMISFIKS